MADDIEEVRAQVIAQCKVVAYLAQEMADLHRDLARYYESPGADPILRASGQRSAHFMEEMGNWLSNMDAVDGDGSKWTAPIFHAAHKMFPQGRNGTDNSEPLKDKP